MHPLLCLIAFVFSVVLQGCGVDCDEVSIEKFCANKPDGSKAVECEDSPNFNELAVRCKNNTEERFWEFLGRSPSACTVPSGELYGNCLQKPAFLDCWNKIEQAQGACTTADCTAVRHKECDTEKAGSVKDPPAEPVNEPVEDEAG